MSRSLTFKGQGTLKTWTGGNDLGSEIGSQMRSMGWAVNDLVISNAPGLGTSLALPFMAAIIPAINYTYGITIKIDVNDEANIDGVRGALITAFNAWFDNVGLQLTYDSARPFESIWSAGLAGASTGVLVGGAVALVLAIMILMPKPSVRVIAPGRY